MIITSFFCLVFFFGTSYAFDKDDFLSHCYSTFEVDSDDFDDCLYCVNIKLNENDLGEFKEQSLNISDAECIAFANGELGVVNGDFFKQFPHAKLIVFESGRFGLSSSDNAEGNENLQSIRVEQSEITGGEVSGAFDDLTNLTTLTIENIRFEELNLAIGLGNILGNLTSLKALTVCGPLDEFLQGIPSSIKELTICESGFERITRKNLESFKDLKILSIYAGNLSIVDEDAFDDLEKLEELDLEYNFLETFSVRHILNNKLIKSVALDPVEHADLSEVGLWETSRTGYFVKEAEVEDYNDSY